VRRQSEAIDKQGAQHLTHLLPSPRAVDLSDDIESVLIDPLGTANNAKPQAILRQAEGESNEVAKRGVCRLESATWSGANRFPPIAGLVDLYRRRVERQWRLRRANRDKPERDAERQGSRSHTRL
jgi:hypothetical protein